MILHRRMRLLVAAVVVVAIVALSVYTSGRQSTEDLIKSIRLPTLRGGNESKGSGTGESGLKEAQKASTDESMEAPINVDYGVENADDVIVEENPNARKSSDEKKVPSLEDERELKSDPNSPDKSEYANNEASVPQENSGTKEDLRATLEQYKSDLEKGIIRNHNPADFNKDYSIKIDKELQHVKPDELVKGNKHIQNLFGQVLDLIQGNRLSFPIKERLNMVNGKTVFENILFYDSDTDLLSEEESSSFINFPPHFVEDLKAKHSIVAENLPDIDPTFYSGNGYVIVGGLKYSWFSMLVIETLRKLGSTLPVEVIIPTSADYEKRFCVDILPKYNARCVVLHDVFGPNLHKVTLTGYQYKAFALLASSFENAFLLDSDTYPVTNPDVLFDSELYKTVKMITWPDYWRRTTSPEFYEIRGTELGGRIRHLNDLWTDKKHYAVENEDIDPEVLRKSVPLHDREGTIPDFTTESGEMMINKRLHFKTLLLALYYNFDGQFGYYPLLSQGGAGEGDKETFVAAANFYSLTYYQVYKKPDRAYGFYKNDEFVDTSIIQYNPIKDHSVLIEVLNKMKVDEKDNEDFRYDYSSYFTDNFQVSNSEPLFYHVHETKLDPYHLIDISATHDPEGKPLRNMGGDWPRFDFDLELFLWNVVNKHLCIENTPFEYFEGKNRNILCKTFIDDHLHFLEKTNYLFLKDYHDSIPYDNLRRAQSSKYVPRTPPDVLQ